MAAFIMRQALPLMFIITVLCAGGPMAATYDLPDTLWVKVTFYDFHYGGNNPNFGAGNCGTSRGLIQDTLDRDRKPVLKANNCYNDRIAEWYRPSGSGNATFNPLTGRWTNLASYQSRPNEWVGSSFSPTYDMANVVMYDSLPFTIADSATGTYRFQRTNAQAFYWLDGRGFGEEPAGSGHNYGYSMELHKEFLYQGGETFRFAGDDDVWVFINGKLALDLGGMQAATARSINLDQMASQLGITPGNTYMFDFFYNERHEPQSDCDITTNILTPVKPGFIIVRTDSLPFNPRNAVGFGDTILRAGDSLRLYGFVIDDTLGIQSNWSNNILWTVTDPLGNPIPATSFQGDNGTFLFTEAYGTVKIVLSYQDPLDMFTKWQSTVYVRVGAGKADHISIEASGDSLVSLRNDNQLNAVVFSPTDTVKRVYAVLRDAYGNWVGASQTTTWTSAFSTIATAAGGLATAGEGVITKKTTGQTLVWAENTQASLIRPRDTVQVLIDPFRADTAYDSLRFGVRNGSVTTTITSLVIGAGSDTLLVVQARRESDGVWVDASAVWTSPPGLRTTIGAPVLQSSWNFVPTVTGQFNVSVSFAGSLSRTLPVTVKAGPPVKVVLYPAAGTPDAGQNIAYPAIPVVVTSAAGAALPLTAKAFDAFGFWVGDYETDSLLARMVSWSAVNTVTRSADTSLGRFNRTPGNPVSFTGTKAYASADIVVSLQYGAVMFRDTMRVTFVASTANHVVIEGDPDWQVSPNRDNPIDTVRLSTARPAASVYAVLRDQYGNFVRYSPATSWVSATGTVATVTAGAPDSGEGDLNAGGTTGSSVVTATCTDTAYTLADSNDQVVVLNQNYWYDSLRITTGTTRVDSVTMLTSQDTVLRVQGRRDNDQTWENIAADWEFVDPALYNVLANPPSAAGSWPLSPTAIDTGRIRVTLGMDGVTTPDTAVLMILPAPPSAVSIRLLTPPSQRRAGDTLLAVVELLNPDGLMPGRYCFPQGGNGQYAVYQDTLGSGGKPDPVVITADTTAALTQAGSAGSAITQCINGGQDTVKFVLYNAPLDPDSVHRIFVSLGSFTASTDPFNLLPGGVDSLVIVQNGQPVGGSVTLIAPDSVQFTVVGFDLWGNPVTSGVGQQWLVTGTLQPPADSLRTADMFTYRTAGIVTDRRGYIVACAGGACDSVYTTVFAVKPVPGPPERVVLYPAAGMPDAGQNTPYPSIPVVVTSVAGAAIPLAVKAFDSLDFWLSEYESDTAYTRMVSWIAVNSATGLPDSSLGAFSASSGNPVTFTGTRAYVTADLIVSLRNGVLVHHDTLRVAFTPAAASHVVIEGDPDGQVSPNRDNPIDTVRLSTVRPSVPLYAVLRDRYGNFVSYSPATSWASATSGVCSVAAAAQDSGKGILNAGGTTGSSVVTATCTEASLLLADSDDQVVVINQNYWYDSLRITTGATRVDSVTMLTSQDTVLRVQGRRDNDQTWENIVADWEFVDLSLYNALANPPSAAGSWSLSPTGAATGRIRVTLGMDGVTAPDTALLVILPAPPSSVSITLLTPPQSRRAGDTILALIELRNPDGLMPGQYCYPQGGNGYYALYQDTLGSGGRPAPLVITGDTSATVTQVGSAGNLISQCITGGLDTVKFVLYYAPSDPDSAHKLFLSLGTLTASTDPFVLLPDSVDSLVIMQNGQPAGTDLSLLAPSDSVRFTVVGYDRWGNRVTAGANQQWSVTGTLPQPADSVKNADLYVFRTAGVTSDISGYVIACAAGACDSVNVYVFGYTPGTGKSLVYAVTRDTNGNGLLDRIEVHFSGMVRPDSIARVIAVSWQGTALAVVRIAGDTTRADSVFELILQETANGQAQTGWTPTVTVAGLASVRDMSVIARDSAGPVVWKAVYMATFPGGDPLTSFDTLKLTLSERVRCPALTAAAVTAGFRYYDGAAGYDPQAPAGARYLTVCGGQQFISEVVILVPVGSFTVTPYEDSIQLAGSATDSAGNAPPAPDIARRATIEAGGGNDIRSVAGPNPFIPGKSDVRTFLGARAAAFYQNVIGSTPNGSIIAVTTRKPLRMESDGSYGRVVIYDAVGNVVRSVKLRQAGSGRDYGVMWDGANTAGRYVGNGGYLAVVMVTDVENTRTVQKVRIGIRRQ